MGDKPEGPLVADYYMSLHFGVCAGPINAIRRIFVGDKEIWNGNVTFRKTIDIDQRDIFGGDEQEGGVAGAIEYLPGEVDQVMPEDLAARLGETAATCPAFRGVTTLFFFGENESDGFLWGTNNPYLKETSVELTSIKLDWYAAKAPIPRTIGEPPIEGYTTWVSLTANAQWKFDTLGFRNAYAERFDNEIKLWTIPSNTLTTITPPDNVVGVHLTVDDFVVSRDGAGDVLYFDFSGNLVAQVTGTLGLLPLNSRCAICDIIVAGEHFTIIMASAEIGGDPRQYVCVTDHAGFIQSATTDAFPDTDICAGPEYAYVYASASTVYRVDWADNPITSTEVTPPGLTGNIANCAYDSLTNSVIIVCTNGDLLRYSPDLTSLIISNTATGIGTVGVAVNSNKRMCPGDGSVVIARQAGGGGTAWHVHVFATSTLSEISHYVSTSQPTWGNPTNAYDHVKYNVEFQSVLMVDHVITGSQWFFPDADRADMNPSHMIYHSVTNTDWGMGSPTTGLDEASFIAAADTLFNEGFGLSLEWSRQNKIEEFVDEIKNHINATTFTHPATGLFTIKLIRNDYVVASLPILDRDNSRVISYARKAWADTVNEIVVSWTNPDNEQDETVILQDLGNISVQGGVVSSSRNYPGIRKPTLAKSVAARDLVAASWPIATAQVEVNRTAWAYVPGDVLKLSADEYGISQIIMRITTVDYGRPGDSKIRLSLVEDIFALPLAEYVDEAPRTRWINPNEDPSAIDFALPQTLTYFHAKKVRDVSGAVYPEVLAAMFAAQAGSDTSRYKLLGPTVDAAGNETLYATLGTRSIISRATLVSGFAAEAQTIVTSAAWTTRTQGAGPVSGGFIQIGSGAETANELALISAISGGNYTLKRGQLDTVPKAWAIGTPIWFFSNSSGVTDPITRAALDTINYKILPITSNGTLNASAASPVSLTTTERPWLPTRPANVTAHGEDFGPVDITDTSPVPSDVAIIWANRNRLSEDTQPLAWTAAGVSPEAGQTTKIEVLHSSTRAVITTHDSLAGSSFNLPVASFGGNSSGIVRVTSERDGFESLQGHEIVVIVSTLVTRDPPSGNLVLSTTAPSIAIETPSFISPPAGNLVLSSVAPSVVVVTPVLISPPAANLVLSSVAPAVVVADPSAHRYWRIHIVSNVSGNLSSITEAQFHTGNTGYGSDVVAGGTASADSEFSGLFAAHNAFDEEWRTNIDNTRWISTNTALPHWLQYDFGAGNEKAITGASMASPADAGAGSFDVKYSDDGSGFTTLWSETGLTSWGSNGFRHFTDPGAASYSGSPHGTHLYWRILQTERDGGNANAISEAEFRATPSGADQATGGTATASAEFDGTTGAAKAFDNDNATLWASTATNPPHWLRYQFASAVAVAEVTIRARSDSPFQNQAPKEFFIQYSDDGTTWTTAWGGTDQTGWTAGETRTFTDPNYV